jgi:hypothetical protein
MDPRRAHRRTVGHLNPDANSVGREAGYRATAHCIEFVNIQFANFIVRIGHVIPPFFWGWDHSRARGDRSMRTSGAPL